MGFNSSPLVINQQEPWQFAKIAASVLHVSTDHSYSKQSDLVLRVVQYKRHQKTKKRQENAPKSRLLQQTPRLLLQDGGDSNTSFWKSLPI